MIECFDGTPSFGGIYAIERLETGDLYVGSAVNLCRRWRSHLSRLRKGSHHCRHLQRAWSLYGEPAFKFYVLERVESKDCLVAREQAYLDLFDPEYNSLKVAGSSLGFKHKPETIAKLVGNKNSKGRIPTPEHRAALSAAQKKRAPFSAEHIARLSEAGKRRFQSPETKAKLSAILRGRKKPPRTASHRAAL